MISDSSKFDIFFGHKQQEDWVLCSVFYKSRGLSSKQSMDRNYEDRSSPSLPPLMETYITFGQTTPVSLEGYEQVPCFSNPFQSSLMTATAMANPPVIPTAIPPNKMPFNSPAAHAWGLPDLASGLNQLDCDKKVIRAVLNHLTKLDGDQKRDELHPRTAEGSIDSYLSEKGPSSMW